MSDTIDTKNHPVVKALEAHRLRLGLNDSQFAQRLQVSGASWYTMREGTYLAHNKQPMLDRFEAALAQFNDQAEAAAARGSRGTIVELRHIRAAIKAVKRSYGQERNRLVVYLAKTGGGKSVLAKHLGRIYLESCVVVEATETWRDSYYAALLSVARALGITDGIGSARKAEIAVVEKLASSPKILVVDEAHHGGKAALNLLKMILNRCQETRVVVAAIPQLWDRMQEANAQEAAQLRSRTCAKLVVPEVGIEDCSAFLKAKLPGFETLGGDTDRSVGAACDSANRFGLFDTLQRICDDDILSSSASKLSYDDIAAAIRRVEALRS